jgi:hypothetical protein
VPIASHTGLIDHGTVVEENLHERFLHACTLRMSAGGD